VPAASDWIAVSFARSLLSVVADAPAVSGDAERSI